MTLGQKIKKLRTEKGITQKDLADQIHVTFQTVSKWESDTNEPDIATIKKLAAFFNCTINELFDEVVELKPNLEETNKYRKVYKTDKAFNYRVVDLYHGYIEGIKKISDDFYLKNSEFYKHQLAKCNFSKTITIQHDSLLCFFVDDNNKTFGFFFNYAPQFVCPFENLASFSLSNSNIQTGYKNMPVTGLGIGRNPSFMVGSVSQTVTNLPLHYYLAINYYDEEGKLCDYKIQFDCNRSYILYNDIANSVEEMSLFEDALSRQTNKCLNEIASLLNAIKDSKANCNLPQISHDTYYKLTVESSEFLKQRFSMIKTNKENQKYMLTKENKYLIVVIGCVVALVVIMIVLIVLYLKYK